MRKSLLLALAITLSSAGAARADGFISPLVGFDFGGDAAGCPAISNCTNKRLNFGVGLGVMGSVFGFEEEFAYAKDFFGDAPGTIPPSSVFTAMTNAMLVPKVGPIRPYVLAGVGLIKTHVDATATSLLTSENNNFGWDIGGGLMITIVPHFGVRGDIRYFHSFQDLNAFGVSLTNQKLDFGRAAGAVVFTF